RTPSANPRTGRETEGWRYARGQPGAVSDERGPARLGSPSRAIDDDRDTSSRIGFPGNRPQIIRHEAFDHSSECLEAHSAFQVLGGEIGLGNRGILWPGTGRR